MPGDGVGPEVTRAALRVLEACLPVETRELRVGGAAIDATGDPLPPETVATRAFLLECFIRGLALTAVRQPDMEPGTIKDSIDSVVCRLLSP